MRFEMLKICGAGLSGAVALSGLRRLRARARALSRLWQSVSVSSGNFRRSLKARRLP